MLINSLICADCCELMTVYELHDFYCAKSKLILQIEERVCLHCGASVWQMVNVVSPSNTDSNLEVGRSESLELSLTSERIQRVLSGKHINALIKLYFLEKIKNICLSNKHSVWYNQFEIDLWEVVIGLSNKIDVSKKDILSLKIISESINLWVIDPSNWEGLKEQPNPFIDLRAWKKLYANRQQLFKQTSIHDS
jgi:hypothetical protein